jgi:predicted ABC-type ATPase
VTERPQLWVIAGPNGAGKSTLTERSFILDNTGACHTLLVTIDQGQVRHPSQHMQKCAKAAISLMPQHPGNRM